MVSGCSQGARSLSGVSGVERKILRCDIHLTGIRSRDGGEDRLDLSLMFLETFVRGQELRLPKLARAPLPG